MSEHKKRAHLKQLDNSQLVKYLLKQVEPDYIRKGGVKENIAKYLEKDTFKDKDLEYIRNTLFEKAIVQISDISFSTFRFKNNCSTSLLLKKFEKITFKNCHFQMTSIDSNNYLHNVVFNQCVFYSQISLNANSTQFDLNRCVFNNKVDIKPCKSIKASKCTFNKLVSLDSSIRTWSDCDFNDNVIINNATISDKLFINSTFKHKLEIFKSQFYIVDFIEHNKRDDFINHLKIDKCTINEDIDFKLNNLEIDTLIINKTIFQSKFEITESVIKNLEFTDSNVAKVFDAFGSTFERTYFYKSIFKGFVGFEQVEFGKENKDDKELIAKFVYTTFESFSNFREAKFHSGLDFERVNLKEQPNFLHARVNQENTNRESFRIIKNSFDAVGNKIEANRFFIQEMKAYKAEMAKKIVKLERKEFCSNFCLNYDKDHIKSDKKIVKKELFIFKINDGISSFGNDYILPILWLMFTIIIYRMIILINEIRPVEFNQTINFILLLMLIIGLIYSLTINIRRYTLLFILSSANLYLWFPIIVKGFYWYSVDMLTYLNDMTKNLLVYSKFLNSGIEFISLIFHIIFLILSWQTVVAIKRRVQR